MQSGQAVTMQFAPASLAIEASLLTILATMSVRLMERLPPQQSVLKDHFFTSAPQAVRILSSSTGFS